MIIVYCLEIVNFRWQLSIPVSLHTLIILMITFVMKIIVIKLIVDNNENFH